jgi:hypothetical protein
MKNFNNPSDYPKLPTNKKFGWFFSALFAIIALQSYSQQLKLLALAACITSFSFAAVTTLFPKALTPLNRVWYGIGMILGKVISPVILGIMFFVLITPVALISRLFGRDELKIKRSFVQSYWVDRLPAGPQSDSFKNQF